MSAPHPSFHLKEWYDIYMSNSYELDFYGIKRTLPITALSSRIKIANFHLLGDVELTEKAGELLEKKLREQNIIPDYFVGPEVKVIPFIYHMAKRFGHNRYVIVRKSIRGYMSDPTIEHPWHSAPPHVKKLVMNGKDKELLHGKKVVLLDDVVSTGATMIMLEHFIERIGAQALAKAALFKQGNKYNGELIYLSELPIMQSS